MNAISAASRPDVAPDAPLNLTVEAAHLEVAAYALRLARDVAQRSLLARGPFAAGVPAGRTLGLMEQAERRLRALLAPEALIALNAILRAQYEAGQASRAEAEP